MTWSLIRSRPAAATAWSLLVMAAATARADEPELMPPYVPTVQDDVDLMLEVGHVGAGDYVIDLGSGDGRIVISAAKRGAFGHGVEIEADLVQEAARRAEEAGVADRVQFVQGDIFDADFSEATVVTMYLYPEINLKLRPKLLAQLRPGTRILSNSFDMGSWKPDVHDMSARSSGGILMWIVPADVGGDWDIDIDGQEESYALDVSQRFQEISLRLASEGRPLAIRSGDLSGDRIGFVATAAGATYSFSGRVDGDGIGGIVQIRNGGESRVAEWRARRVEQQFSHNTAY